MTDLLTDGDTDVKDARYADLENTIHRQEVAIAMLRQRLHEVEFELVETRCLNYELRQAAG